MPKSQIKTEPVHNQNEDSYEQQIFEDQLPSPKGSSEAMLLDENEEFEIYDDFASDTHQQKTSDYAKAQSLSKIQYPQANEERQSSSIDFGLSDLKNAKHEPEQPDTDLEYETQQVAQLLKSKYSHFDQNTLIQILYEKCFPKNIKAEPIETINERKNFDNIDKITKAAKIFVQHGYGINIARQYAEKGEDFSPNPYNNTIAKIIKFAWKGIEKQIQKIRKKIRPLKTQQYNQIKTPLINARQWMTPECLHIFLNITAYVNGVKSIKPSPKDYQKLYDFLIPKAKGKMPSVGKQKGKKSRHDESSEEFKVPKHQEKKITYGKLSKGYSKKQYDD